MFNNSPLSSPSPETLAVYEIMWKKYGRGRQTTDENIIRRMRIAFWINKATNKYSVYVIHIALPRQRWILERACMLRHMYSACHIL